MRRVLLLASTMLLLACGCARPTAPGEAPALDAPAAPQATAASQASGGTPASPVAPHASPAAPPQGPSPTKMPPPKSTGLPPDRVEGRSPPNLVTSCRTDADCTVKNVGNCCGAMPACVNTNSPVDPAAVKADCAARGVMSTCGFKDVQSCSCVAGTCRDAGNGAVAQ